MSMQYFGRANRSRLSELLVLAFAMFVLVQASYSQGTSGVTGVVADSAGKVVPGATVTLTDTKTERILTTTTNDQGSYTFSSVQPGADYKLTVAASAFRPSH
jgi:protocatechuate 3,4-dioxygenase beta subunit